jgi:hypothetical protein
VQAVGSTVAEEGTESWTDADLLERVGKHTQLTLDCLSFAGPGKVKETKSERVGLTTRLSVVPDRTDGIVATTRLPGNSTRPCPQRGRRDAAQLFAFSAAGGLDG